MFITLLVDVIYNYVHFSTNTCRCIDCCFYCFLLVDSVCADMESQGTEVREKPGNFC